MIFQNFNLSIKTGYITVVKTEENYIVDSNMNIIDAYRIQDTCAIKVYNFNCLGSMKNSKLTKSFKRLQK